MKYLIAVVNLLLSVSIKADVISDSLLWDEIQFYKGIGVLRQSKPELRFSIFDPSSKEFYPVNSIVLDKESSIRGVDFIRDQPYLKVEVESLSEKRTLSAGVMDLKGNWIINPVAFSVSELVPGFAIGYSQAGNIEIRNFQDETVKLLPREWRCKITKFDNGALFPCDNSGKLIRLNLQSQSERFTELEYSGIFLAANSEANLFVFQEKKKIIISSELKKNLYEFDDTYGINFLTNEIFGVYSLFTGINEKYYHLEKGKLDLNFGSVQSVESFGGKCLRWRATLDGIESTRIMDSQAHWHVESESLAELCNLKSELQTAAKLAPIDLRVSYTDDRHCGYQNEKNEWQIKPIFSSCREFVAQAGVVTFEGIWGIINRRGEWLTERAATRSLIVKEWDARNPNEIKAGVIDTQGHWVIPPMLNEKESFLVENGVVSCRFKTVSGCHRLDFTGGFETISSQEVDEIKQKIKASALPNLLEENIKPVAINGSWGFQKPSGEWLIAPKYDQVEYFSNGVAPVAVRGEKQNMLWGLVDELGRELIAPKYQDIQTFYNKVSWFKQNDKWGLLDRDGIELTKAQFVEVKPIKSDLAMAIADSEETAFPNSRVLLKIDGQIVQPDTEVTDYIDPFQRGVLYSRARSGEAWGYIDREGKWLKPPEFESASSFAGDYALVTLKEYDHQRGKRKDIWQAPDQEQGTLKITNIEQIQHYPILKVDILRGTEELVALFDAEHGKWISKGLND